MSDDLRGLKMTDEAAVTADIDEFERLDEFVAAYIQAALWSSTDESDDSGGEPLDRNYDESDIAPETLARMREDCLVFLANRLGGRLIAIAERLESEGTWSLPAGAGCSVLAYAGHDAWLTRNGHGCGFDDGDWPRGIAEGLAKLAKEFGEYNLYLGDDHRIHGV